ncbi:MAG: hypothetical protein Q9193_000581, partial [Seirophora villosa]
MISSIKKILNPRHLQDPGSSVRPERKLCILRIIQLILVFGYVPCIAHSSTSTGRWTYASMKTSISLGSGAAALTCLLEMLYLCLRRQTYRRSSLQSHKKAICYLLLRMSGDACAAVLWFSAFVAALLPKRQDYRGFLQSPPYATWVASAVLALTEWYVVFAFN